MGGDVLSADADWWFQMSKLHALRCWTIRRDIYSYVCRRRFRWSDNYGNNSLVRNFEVTTDVYSQDGIDVQPASILALGSLGSNSFTSELSNTVLTAMYHMRETENQVNGIQIALASGSAEGAELTVSIIDTAVFLADGIGAVTGLNGNYAESGIYALTADDIANGYANIFL